MSLNQGHSSRLGYDDQTYADKIFDGVGPGQYRLSPDQMYNCDNCFSSFGPRPSVRRGQEPGIDANVDYPIATSQNLVDVESILSNRNVKQSKSRSAHLNFVDVTKFPLKHNRICNQFLDPLSSRLAYPSSNYRDMAVNRFYNTNQNLQLPIFWDFAVNTSLEAKDNFIERLPRPKKPSGLPDEILGVNPPCKIPCTSNCNR